MLVILGDAHSEIYYTQLEEEECTRTVLAAGREGIETQGLLGTLYRDRGRHFFVRPKAGEKVDQQRLTQVGRALRELGVQMIPAYLPLADNMRILPPAFKPLVSRRMLKKAFCGSSVLVISRHTAAIVPLIKIL